MALTSMEDLEEALEALFPKGYQLETDDNGEIIIYTGLSVNRYDELVSVDGEEDDEDEDFDADEHYVLGFRSTVGQRTLNP